MLEKSSRCQMCGTADWEWEEDRFAYEPQERICRGCELKDMTNESSDDRPGRSVVLVPKAVFTPQYRKRQRQLYEESQKAKRAERQQQLGGGSVTRDIEVRW